MAVREVQVKNGKIHGCASGIPTVSVFKGIPYAAAPVGELRFRAPTDCPDWDGIYQAVEYGPIPVQDRIKTKFNREEFAEYGAEEPMGEDCLRLHIWTPAESSEERLPVMVWFHGGGFVEDYAYNVVVDGDTYGERFRTVLVSVEYRLGILGFLAHPLLTAEGRTSGNYGLLDQRAALLWIRENIGVFGGDPDNVTVFGESAGGISVLQHLCSPLSRGLFHRAIVMSGTGYFGKMLDARREQQTLKAAEKTGERVFEKLGIADLEQLRRVPAEAFISVQREMPEAFLPVIEGCFCTDWLDRLLLENRYANVPILMGCTSQEAGLFRAQGDKSGRDWNRFFQIPAFAWAELAAECQERKPVYFYWFSRSIPNLGPWHAMELHYLFHVLHRTSRRLYQADLDLEDAMAAYWCNFAAAGDPNGEGLVRWEPYTQESGGVLELGDLIRMRRRSDFLELSAEVDFALGK